MSDDRVQIMISRAFKIAEDLQHEYVTLEHMLYVLLEDGVIGGIIEEIGGNPQNIHNMVYEHLKDEMESVSKSGVETKQTKAVDRVFQRAMTQMLFKARQSLTAVDIFASILVERESYAAFICSKEGVTQESLADLGQLPADQTQGNTTSKPGSKRAKVETALDKYTVNLNKEAAANRIDHLCGRDSEIEMTIQTLVRRKKNNVILVGEAGVGKTAIAEGLAKRIVDGEVPEAIEGYTIYSLQISALMAGTKYRGDFEERMQELMNILEKKDKSILFIDEIHMIMGAGSTGSGGMDVANILKPALQKGNIRCIGSTTYDEFRENIEKDRALTRRFQKVDVAEPTAAETKMILRQAMNAYETFYGMQITEEAMAAAVDLSVQYLHDRRLPDKAFDVVDSTFARQRIKPADARVNEISEIEVRFEISKIARIPVDTVINSDILKTPTINIEEALSKRVFGQAEAIDVLADAVYISKAGLKDKNKPVGSYLFTGPTGVGKTETAKALSDLLSMPLVRFDMSEYQEKHTLSKLIGAPPGYVGYGEGGSGALISELEKTPNCILLLDEVEKAHPDVLNVLLQVMDNGMVSGSDGKTVSARNAIVILTSNLGAADSQRNKIGFGGGKHDEAQDEAVKKFFSPEFRNRLDATIEFKKLTQANINNITEKFLNELKAMVKDRGYKFTWNKTVLKWLSERGFDDTMGARPMARVINEQIKKPLSRKMLFDEAAHTDIKVTIKNGEIDIQYR